MAILEEKVNWFHPIGVLAVCLFSSCAELKRPEPNPYLAESRPPEIKELRWANGGPPKTLDPAFAGAAPEIDVVRAIYEGLTVTDPNTLEALPGVAESWTVSDDGLQWTFKLRDDAKWSNGKRVSANDFVRSWQRLNKLGVSVAHANLLDNFARAASDKTTPIATEPEDFDDPPATIEEAPAMDENAQTSSDPGSSVEKETSDPDISPDESRKIADLEIRAPDATTLTIKLIRPDRDLPRVVAHPIFGPVHSSLRGTNAKPNPRIVTNGAFKIASIDDALVSVERSPTYWNREAVALDRISFISVQKAEDALTGYRDGKIDVVTNTEFAPLAQKLFAPYADFRSSPFGALNFYQINHRKAPFNDRRVREALAISLEREKLTQGETEGATQPAFGFLPFSSETKSKVIQDRERAAELLEQAGFSNGRGFPTIRLVINRNEVQHRVARAVAAMWKAALNIETDIVLAESAELESIRAEGNYDLLRRGVVFPTSSELASMSAIFGVGQADSSVPTPSQDTADPESDINNGHLVRSEAAAIYDMHAIPLYFPISFALVKPYIVGFEMNSLDARPYAVVSINGEWSPPAK